MGSPSRQDTTAHNLHVALTLAEAGIPIFPAEMVANIGRQGTTKKPCVKDWQAKATTDPKTIRGWWTKFPQAFPGIPTGPISGLALLDLDVKDGRDGIENLRVLGYDLDDISPIAVRTTSGGEHRWCSHVEGLRNTSQKIARGVDTRGEGGWGAAPGSVTPKGQYEVVDGTLEDFCDLVSLIGLPPFPADLVPAHTTHEATDGIEPTGLPWSAFLDALDQLDNSGDAFPSRDDWFRVLAAIHAESEGNEEGRAAAHEWSEQHPSNDPADTDAVWNSLKAEKAGGVSGWYVVKEAEAKGWSHGALLELRNGEARALNTLFDACWTAEELEQIEREAQLREVDELIYGPPEPSPLGVYELNEDGVIRAFTDLHRGELLFDHHEAMWFRFNGNIWRREETKLAHHYAREVSTTLALRDPKGAKALNKVSSWEAVERGSRFVREFAVSAGHWDRSTMLLGTPGGVVDLTTGTMRQGVSSEMVSKSTAAAPIPPHKFDPARDCPNWLAFLDHALEGDEEAIRFFQQWAGYNLTGETREQVLLFVYGPGGAGKSTAVNVLTDLLGDYAIAVATSTLTQKKQADHSEEIARLHGPRMAVANETERNSHWAENRIKEMTGGDKLTAHFMRQNSFSFVPVFKLTIVGNNAPALSDVDTAIRRRFLILPFDNPPTVKDEDLPKRLRAEQAGILSWAIQGCLDWQKNGLLRPGIVDRATAEYFAREDTFTRWIEDDCVVGRQEADTTDNLFQSWSHHARQNGEDPGAKNKAFAEKMQKAGFKLVGRAGDTRQRGYRGVRALKKDDFS